MLCADANLVKFNELKVQKRGNDVIIYLYSYTLSREVFNLRASSRDAHAKNKIRSEMTDSDRKMTA